VTPDGTVNMRTLTIYTDAYLKELDVATGGFIRRIMRPEQGLIKLYYETFDVKGFYMFLDWAAFQENTALRSVPKLAELTRKFIPQDVGRQNIECLAEYIKNYRVLNVEGYIHFRMTEYNDYLNCLLYAIIKRTII